MHCKLDRGGAIAPRVISGRLNFAAHLHRDRGSDISKFQVEAHARIALEGWNKKRSNLLKLSHSKLKCDSAEVAIYPSDEPI